MDYLYRLDDLERREDEFRNLLENSSPEEIEILTRILDILFTSPPHNDEPSEKEGSSKEPNV